MRPRREPGRRERASAAPGLTRLAKERNLDSLAAMDWTAHESEAQAAIDRTRELDDARVGTWDGSPSLPRRSAAFATARAGCS